MTKTSYYETKLALSDDQMQSLQGGATIRIKFEQLDSPVPDDIVHLTRTQQKKLERAHSEGKGTTLRMSGAQLSYIKKSGSGVLSNFLNRIRDGGLSAANWVGSKGINLAGNLAKSQTSKVSGLLPSLWGIDTGADQLLQGGIDFGSQFGKDKLSSFLTGLKSTREGGALLHGLKFRTAINRPLEEQFRRPANMPATQLSGMRTEGGAIYLPGSR